MDIIERINTIKKEKNAIILAHNYQPEEIQNIADFVGDSLELCIIAKETTADIIVFCGVDFMAETAKILNKDKKVLIPEIKDVECPMAHQLPPKIILDAKKEHPNAKVVIYVNTLASAKAIADSTCTSANADKVINSFEEDKILFGPDNNLGYFVSKRTDKEIICIPKDGGCYVHQKFKKEDVIAAKKQYPNAVCIAHPECAPEVQDLADAVLSTGGMVKFVLETPAEEIIIGTECDMIVRLNHELKKAGKTKKLIPLRKDAICDPMKQMTLEKVEKCLINEEYEITLDEEVIEQAKKSIERMLNI
ncbi:quinolinate synthase NadA [Methanococcus aeolicus]|uniref:Quinolinate synthase n=1 Tax=Methanococcus aeolicus (strain ATCC BAA-1280 / DSM 17508 / OCM 812 / Nankai-3) TaxID=419665 RepID=A6UUF9_META3|nr:quinolinate synthase NadA [Methanococcus aeolicus]ABR56131.1 quinolinate synthetase complex, A subunit [Methanococcus aeolicus Nankai-3]UXM85258.1 quinolinate synthase NadA [Methanococcus aeolicus]